MESLEAYGESAVDKNVVVAGLEQEDEVRMTPAEHLAPDSIEREAEVELKEEVLVAAEVQLGVLDDTIPVAVLKLLVFVYLSPHMVDGKKFEGLAIVLIFYLLHDASGNCTGS